MRRSHLVAFASTVLVIGSMSVPAEARTISISGTHSTEEIQKKCIDAGGDFSMERKGKVTYSFTCDNTASGGGKVVCSGMTHKCTGTVPGVMALPQTLDDLLAAPGASAGTR
jgi:hypothetical protein